MHNTTKTYSLSKPEIQLNTDGRSGHRGAYEFMIKAEFSVEVCIYPFNFKWHFTKKKKNNQAFS